MRTASYFLLALGPLLWAGNFIVGRSLAGEFDPGTLNYLRWSVAAIAVVPILLADARSAVRILWTSLAPLTILALLGIIGSNTVLYAALEHAEAGTTSILYATNPIILGLLCGLTGNQRFTVVQWLGGVISMTGVVLTVGYLSDGPINFAAAALALLATLLFALYTFLSGVFRVPGRTLTVLALTIWIGFLLKSPTHFPSLVVLVPGHLPAAQFGALMYLGLGASLVAYLAWQAGVRSVGYGRASVFINLLPVFTVLMAGGLLQEEMTRLQWFGLALVLSGVLLTQVRYVLAPRHLPSISAARNGNGRPKAADPDISEPLLSRFAVSVPPHTPGRVRTDP